MALLSSGVHTRREPILVCLATVIICAWSAEFCGRYTPLGTNFTINQSVVIAGCSCQNQSEVQIDLSSDLVMRELNADGCSFVVRCMSSCNVTLINSTIKNSVSAFSFTSNAASNITIRVVGTQIAATHSAVSVDYGPSAPTVDIYIEDSVITVTDSAGKGAVAASVLRNALFSDFSFTMAIRRSTIRASSNAAYAIVAGVVFPLDSKIIVNLTVLDSVLEARGSGRAVSAGLTNEGNSVKKPSRADFLLNSNQSTITAMENQALGTNSIVASGGISINCAACYRLLEIFFQFTTTQSVIVAQNAGIGSKAMGLSSAAAVVVGSLISWLPSISVLHFHASASGSVVTANTTQGIAASLGIVISQPRDGDGDFTAAQIALSAVNSSVSSDASDGSAAMGIVIRVLGYYHTVQAVSISTLNSSVVCLRGALQGCSGIVVWGSFSTHVTNVTAEYRGSSVVSSGGVLCSAGIISTCSNNCDASYDDVSLSAESTNMQLACASGTAAVGLLLPSSSVTRVTISASNSVVAASTSAEHGASAVVGLCFLNVALTSNSLGTVISVAHLLLASQQSILQPNAIDYSQSLVAMERTSIELTNITVVAQSTSSSGQAVAGGIGIAETVSSVSIVDTQFVVAASTIASFAKGIASAAGICIHTASTEPTAVSIHGVVVEADRLNCESNSTTATCLGVSVLTNASGSSAVMSIDSVTIAASNSHMLLSATDGSSSTYASAIGLAFVAFSDVRNITLRASDCSITANGTAVAAVGVTGTPVDLVALHFNSLALRADNCNISSFGYRTAAAVGLATSGGEVMGAVVEVSGSVVEAGIAGSSTLVAVGGLVGVTAATNVTLRMNESVVSALSSGSTACAGVVGGMGEAQQIDISVRNSTIEAVGNNVAATGLSTNGMREATCRSLRFACAGSIVTTRSAVASVLGIASCMNVALSLNLSDATFVLSNSTVRHTGVGEGCAAVLGVALHDWATPTRSTIIVNTSEVHSTAVRSNVYVTAMPGTAALLGVAASYNKQLLQLPLYNTTMPKNISMFTSRSSYSALSCGLWVNGTIAAAAVGLVLRTNDWQYMPYFTQQTTTTTFDIEDSTVVIETGVNGASGALGLGNQFIKKQSPMLLANLFFRAIHSSLICSGAVSGCMSISPSLPMTSTSITFAACGSTVSRTEYTGVTQPWGVDSRLVLMNSQLILSGLNFGSEQSSVIYKTNFDFSAPPTTPFSRTTLWSSNGVTVGGAPLNGTEVATLFPGGRVHVPDADLCCRALVFNAQAAASANCFQCPVRTSGALSVEVPTAVCADCEAGTYNNATGRRDCTPCGVNQYNNLTGQAKCFPCPRGTVARREGNLACASPSTTLSETSTATMSASLQCAAEVYRREAVAVDVEMDEDAVRMYGLHAVANISGLLRLHPSWAATPDGRVPISVLVDVAENQQPNPFGFQALSRVRAEVWMNATASWKERRMDLATPPFPQLSLDVDETILVYALPGAFFVCRPTVPVLILTWTVTAAPEPLAAATWVVAAVVSQSVTAGSVIGGASGGGAAGDVQALATIGMLSCTQPRDRAMLSNTRLLSPAALSNEFVGMLLGNFILIALCALAHYLIVQVYQLVLRRRSSISSKAGSASTPKTSESDRTHDTMVCIRYPSRTITVTKVLYQGTALASAQLLASSDGLEVVLGVVGVVYSLALPVVLTMVKVRYVNAEFHTYNIDNPSALREPLLPSPGGNVEESIKASALVAFARRFIMPAGVWEPKDARKMYGSLFSSSRRPEIVWVALPLLPSLVLAAASTIHPASTSGCQALFASLACLAFLLVCALLAFWPYRSHCITGLAAASSACLGLVLVGNAIMAEDPGSSSARSLTLWSTQALMVVSVLRMAHVAVLYMFESRLMDSVPRTLAFRLTAVGKAKRLRGEANEDTLDDDEELQHAEATTQQALAVPVADVALPQPTSDPAPVPPPPPPAIL